MEKIVKKQLLQFLKKFKDFRKLNKDDFKTNRDLAKEILMDCINLMTKEEIQKDKKVMAQLNKTEEGLKIFINNMDTVLDFSKNGKKK